MKNAIMNTAARLFLLAMCFVSGIYAFAQDGGTNSQSNTTVTHTQTSAATAPDAASTWYMNPVVWVIAALVLFAIILIAVIGSRNRNAVSRSTTTTTTLKTE